MEDSLASPDATESIKRFEESEQATRDARIKAERDIDYRDNKQWTAEEEAALKKRGQPVVTYNRIQRKVNYLKGLETQSRKDPKAFPRTPGDDGSAQAATDSIRYVCDDCQWDQKRSEAFEDIIVPGTGAIFVGGKQVKGGVDPYLIQIPWDRFYYDPYSRRVDFSDASYLGIVTWMEMADVVRQHPDKKDIIDSTVAKAKDTETYDDRPKDHMWADYKRQRVRVCEEYYLKDGVWHTCTFTGGGFLKEPAPSPYLDEDGNPECPIKAISAYIDRDNNRFGEVRSMIGPQDEINKRRSKALHLINSRQLRIEPGVSVSNGQSDPSSIKRELAKPDGVFFGAKDAVEVLMTNDMAAANLQLLQEAKAEIDLLGPNAALAGKNENDASGRALLAQQQGGMIEVALLMDRLRTLSLAVYRSIFARIKQYWTAERWIRVTDDERNLRWVGLNTPRTMIEIAAERLEGDPQAEMKLQLLSQDPRARMVMEVQNPVADMDVDIVIDEGMDTPMVQAEQFDTLSKMLPSLIQLPPMWGKALIMASNLRDKDKILELLDEMNAPDPMAQQMQQAQVQLEFQGAQAEIDKTKSETVKNIAQAQAADPTAQIQLEREKAEHQMALNEDKQAHGQMIAERAQVQRERQPQQGAR